MPKTSLYDQATYEECLGRLQKINADTNPLWGKMNAAQMFSHCAEVVDVTNGKALKVPFLIRAFFKGAIRKVVFGDQPYPKNSRTNKQFIKEGELDFEKERKNLLQSLAQFYTMPEEKAAATKHVLFGLTTREEKGWSMYKHLDHHLKQFGV